MSQSIYEIPVKPLLEKYDFVRLSGQSPADCECRIEMWFNPTI